MGTLKPQSNRPLYSNTVIGTLAIKGWAVTFGTVKRGLDSTYYSHRSSHLVRRGMDRMTTADMSGLVRRGLDR